MLSLSQNRIFSSANEAINGFRNRLCLPAAVANGVVVGLDTRDFVNRNAMSEPIQSGTNCVSFRGSREVFAGLRARPGRARRSLLRISRIVRN